MTGAFIIGWYLAVEVINGGPTSITQYGPYYDEASCESAKIQIREEFGPYGFHAVCTPSDKDLKE